MGHGAGHLQAVASSASRANLDAILTELPFGDCFDAIASGDEISRGKPDPEIFLCAAAKLRAAPGTCVVVEDADVGVAAAKRAGMRVYAVTTTGAATSSPPPIASLTASTSSTSPRSSFRRGDAGPLGSHCGRNRYMAKVSISMDDADLRWLRRRARRLYGGNLSAAIAEATRLIRHNEALGALLDDLGAPDLSRAEIDAIARELRGTPRRPKRRRRAA